MTALTKPVRRVAEAREMPHGFRNRLIITLYPGAVVSIREARHKDAIELDLAKLYVSAVTKRALSTPIKRRTSRAR